MMLSSPLKYPGGKSFLIEKLSALWINLSSRRWVDLSCGGLSLPLALAPKKALLADINPTLINFWNWVKTDGKVTIQMQYEDSFYYQKRDEFNSLEGDDSTKAQLLYYLNKTCYNGLIRFSQSNKFNTPVGRHKAINYRKDFLDYQQAIAGWDFHCGDFREVFKMVEPEDFIYSDPPYFGVFSSYYGKFGWSDHVALANLLATHPGPVVASNSAAPEIILLYSELGFDIAIIEAPRKISCKSDKRSPASEILATRNINVSQYTNDGTNSNLYQLPHWGSDVPN